VVSTTSSSWLDVVEPGEVGISTTSRLLRGQLDDVEKQTGRISTALSFGPGTSQRPLRLVPSPSDGVECQQDAVEQAGRALSTGFEPVDDVVETPRRGRRALRRGR